MSKLKIERGASRVRRVALKTTVDGTVADDIELMCEWSENETSYVVTELLRFALAQSDEFQAHKQSRERRPEMEPKADVSPRTDLTPERQAPRANPTTASEVAR
jgi:hypothetical protein